MTAVIVAVTLLAVAVLAVAWLRYCEVSREVEVAMRNTPAPFNVADEWCDCQVCATARTQLADLFNDTNPKEQ